LEALRYLYVASENDGPVAIFERNLISGTLTFAGFLKNGIGSTEGLGGAYSVAISPDNRHAYVAGFTDDALAVFSRKPGTGAFTFIEVHRGGVGPVDGLDGANSVAVSPDGAHVYVAARYDASVAIFSRNLTSGSLTYQGIVKDGVNGVSGLGGARGLAVSPTGSHIYISGFDDNAVAVFSRFDTSLPHIMR